MTIGYPRLPSEYPYPPAKAIRALCARCDKELHGTGEMKTDARGLTFAIVEGHMVQLGTDSPAVRVVLYCCTCYVSQGHGTCNCEVRTGDEPALSNDLTGHEPGLGSK